MRFARPFQLLGCLTLVAGAAQCAHATPITYQFTTAPLSSSPFPPFPVTGPSSAAIQAALSGLSVAGSFVYESDTPLTSTTNGPVVFNQANYENSISDFSGSVGTFSFTAATGKMDVADEGYRIPILPTPLNEDFLQLVSITDKGFSFQGLPLVTARLFWIEGNTTSAGTPDFLTGNTLPTLLPDFSGRFALDFLDKDAAGNVAITTAFFNGLTVTLAPPPPSPVPEPGTPGLLTLAGAALIALRKRLGGGVKKRFAK